MRKKSYCRTIKVLCIKYIARYVIDNHNKIRNIRKQSKRVKFL